MNNTTLGFIGEKYTIEDTKEQLMKVSIGRSRADTKR